MILLQYQKKKIMRNLEITKNIDIKNYNIDYISTKSTSDRTMFYITNPVAYKPRLDLNIKPVNQN